MEQILNDVLHAIAGHLEIQFRMRRRCTLLDKVTQMIRLSRRVGYKCMRGGRNAVLTKHQHNDAYLALVLEGGYEEAGDGGWVRVQPGDVVLHAGFETHVNRYSSAGSQLIVLDLPQDLTIPHPVMHVRDGDLIARVAERNPREALELVLEEMQPVGRTVEDWPQALAAALRDSERHMVRGATCR
jgi:hypothetical protein